MQRIRSGSNFASYALGGLTIVALRDGHVDMPPSRLRRPGDRPFGADLPEGSGWSAGGCGFPSRPSWSSGKAGTS
ncbi:hypothetical protein [Plastoroseomonas hellenica]|uniref:hypothetical protein n=1 Tax=Plastoroseomonas hellenica TaxID=2687306 RepID=UPI001BADCAC0|nr:hypothetical protein [Plastoroseomonas hellenica]